MPQPIIEFSDVDNFQERIEALEAENAELKVKYEHKCKAKNCYYDCVDKGDANQQIATAQESAWRIIRDQVDQMKQIIERYVTPNGYCKPCAGAGDNARGEPCPFCRGVGMISLSKLHAFAVTKET